MRVRGVLENQLINPQESVYVRLIVIPQSLFFLNGVALVIQILLRDLQRAHPIAFQPERQRQVTRREGFVVVCPLCGSGAVHGAAGGKDILKVSRLGNVFRSLKHHVLEEMGETGSSQLFITRTDVVVQSDGYDRHSMVFAQNNAKTIGKIKLLDGGWRKRQSIGHFDLDSCERLSVRLLPWE